jgi:transposase
LATERLSMRKLREILRLHHESKLPARAIARSCRLSSSTVLKYLGRATVAKVTWPLPPELDDITLEHLLFPDEHAPVRQRPEPDWALVHQELRRKHVTKALVWQEYREAVPNGYQYSQFCEHYARWRGTLSVVMRRDHKAGEKTFVDFSGDGIDIIDPRTGEVTVAKLFLAVLGASNLTFIEPVLAEDLPNWIQCHIDAFAYFGGVTEITVPDNLKSGVTKPDYYDPDINRTYASFAEHYATAVMPARVRKPRDKAKVEQGVLLAERWVIAVLRHREFHSLGELRVAVRELMERLNNKPMQKLKMSRWQLFEAVERAALKPLPAVPFELCDWKHVRLDIDYHVEYDGHFYSVLYSHYLDGHRDLWVRATASSIEVFYASQRIAAHARSYDRHPLRRYITLPEHMPESHRADLEWPPHRMIAWAKTIGPSTQAMIETLLEKFPHPEQGYKSCRAILRLAKTFPAERLEKACTRALHYRLIGFKNVETILKNRLDQQPLEEEARSQLALPLHENVRGPGYYH